MKSAQKFFPRALISTIFFVVGALYFALLIPIFWPGVNVLGVNNPSLSPNRALSIFEIFWQPVCGILYIVASVKFPKIGVPGRKFFAIFALISSFIEALVLNIYLLAATRISRPFIDGIFTSAEKYPFSRAVFCVLLPLATMAFLGWFFARESHSAPKSGKM